MADLAVIAMTPAFFVLAWLYVRACERIQARVEVRAMTPEHMLGLLLSLVLLAYLVYALLYPERF